jgi:hypothetical protein
VSRRLIRAAGVAGAAVALAGAASMWSGAAAQAPTSYGWWSATNNGMPVSPTPPDVPADGLYVENGFTGPTAVAALDFTVPAGATVGTITVKTAGSPLITAPPIACLLTAASFKPAEGGAWSDKPSYDCRTQARGTVGSGNASIAFPAAGLIRNGRLAVAILAGAQTDRIPFQKPGPGTLVVTQTPTGAPAGNTGATTATGSGYGGGATTTAPSGGGGSVPAALPPGGAVAAGTAPDTGVAPAVAAPAASAGPSTTTAGSVPSAASGSTRPSRSDTGTKVATGFGLTAMIAAMLFWTEGFGPLGGRVSTFAARRRGDSAYPDDPLSAQPTAAARS